MELLILVATVFQLATALECGINISGSEEQFREITSLCLTGNRTSVVYGLPTTEQSVEGSTLPITTGAPVTEAAKKPRESSSSEESDESETSKPTTESPKTVGQNCVVQCVFERLGMTDSNGYPEHHQILEGLLKTAEGRELRDFLQDATDECFQLMQQADTLDACTYSSLLVTCLADKGRSNCGDWPVGKLPFH